MIGKLVYILYTLISQLPLDKTFSLTLLRTKIYAEHHKENTCESFKLPSLPAFSGRQILTPRLTCP